jgi:hypothetical protein
MRPIILVYLSSAYLCFATQGGQPTPFEYRGFASHPNLNIAGAAHYIDKTLRLTDAEGQSAGAAWHGNKEPLTAGFDTTFTFRFTEQGGNHHGADGLALVLQNSGPSAVAGRGSAGGWGSGDGLGHHDSPGIPRAIAIFFDTYQNKEDNDPSDNYVGIYTNGGLSDMPWPPHRLAYTPRLRVKLKDGKVHTARILYRPPLLSVYLDNPSKAVLVSPVDISLVADPAGSAWVGFTASTGGSWENHDLLSWTFNSTEVTSAMVSSNISFFMDRCQPGHNLCTPDKAIVDESRPGRYHIVLPANQEWGASIPNPSAREVVVDDARGTACWDLQALGSEGCSGPDGSPSLAGWLSKDKPAGALILKNQGGRTYFSVNDRNFADNEGYFEFEVEVR